MWGEYEIRVTQIRPVTRNLGREEMWKGVKEGKGARRLNEKGGGSFGMFIFPHLHP